MREAKNIYSLVPPCTLLSKLEVLENQQKKKEKKLLKMNFEAVKICIEYKIVYWRKLIDVY